MIKWVDLLILIVKAHGEALRELALFFGESEFIEILENINENSLPNSSALFIEPSLITPPSRDFTGFSPLEALEQAVRESSLPAVLEFYVWTYPFYRTLIEMPIDLRSLVHLKTHPEFIETFCNLAIEQANQWVQNLTLSAVNRGPVERIVRAPWLRLRSEVFKRLGRRPLTTLSKL